MLACPRLLAVRSDLALPPLAKALLPSPPRFCT